MDLTERFRRAHEVRDRYPEFLDFVYDAMEFLGFDLTDMQADIAHYMQHGPRFRVVFAQRSEAKSTIACIYALWYLVHNPSARVVLVSAGTSFAEANGRMIWNLLNGWEVLEYMVPDSRVDRTSSSKFDIHHQLKGFVRDASVYCIGITGQLTGFRADLLIPDDIEIPTNSSTPTMRAKLLELSREFTSLCDGGAIMYLGTPQTKDSIYNTLPGRGFDVRIWPGRYPSQEHLQAYGTRLAPFVKNRLDADPSLARGAGADGTRGQPTDPNRVPEAELLFKEVDQGPEKFELQFMLNTRLMDEMRQQLKPRDLIVLETGSTRVPEVLEWGPTPNNRLQWDQPLAIGDNPLHGPSFIGKDYAPLNRLVMTVDPASEGGDDVAFALGGVLGPYIHVVDWGGFRGGMSEENMTKLLDVAQENGCDNIIVERNMGGGIATKLLQGHAVKLNRKVSITDVNSSGQKERRIIDCVGPLLRRHRLVMHRKAIERDLETTKAYPMDRRTQYSGLFQMDNITTDRGCLVKDDRIDALEQLCRALGSAVLQDEHKAAAERKEALGREFMANPMGYTKTQQGASPKQFRGSAFIQRRF